MRVRITTTVEIDRERWAAEFGTAPDAASVRDDVKTYFQNGCDEQLLTLGLGKVVRDV